MEQSRGDRVRIRASGLVGGRQSEHDIGADWVRKLKEKQALF